RYLAGAPLFCVAEMPLMCHATARFGFAALTLSLGAAAGPQRAAPESDSRPIGEHVAPGKISTIAASGGGLAAGLSDGRIAIWKTGATVVSGQFAAYNSSVSAIAFSPDGRFLAGAASSGEVGLWNAETGSRAGFLKTSAERPACIDVANGG